LEPEIWNLEFIVQLPNCPTVQLFSTFAALL
jgi:hypothetical protein